MFAMTTTPKQFAKAHNYFVIVRDAAGEVYDDKTTGTDGKIRAVPFAFKTERTAIRHAARRGMFYVRPNGDVIDSKPASHYWGFCSFHGNYTPRVGCRKCAEVARLIKLNPNVGIGW